MIDLDKLDATIKAAEGKRNYPYYDTQGKLTIGWGHCLSSNGLSDAVITTIYIEDRNIAVAEAKNQAWWTMVADNDTRSRAFIELIFEMGVAGLAGFSRALDAAMHGDWSTCASEIRNSLYYRQVGARAERIACMIETGGD